MKTLSILAVLFLTACAGHGDIVQNEQPAYWMTKYANADQAKTNRCMARANEAYEKAGGTQGRGDNGFAVLAKGTAWEKCMTS